MPFARPLPVCMILAAGACFAQPQVQLPSPDNCFVLLENRLLRTQTAGREWTDITPFPEPGGAIDGFFFLDGIRGWAFRAFPSPQLASTADAGATWTAASFTATTLEDLQSYGGAASLHFVDAAHGWLLLRRASSSNFSLGSLFFTSDGGARWTRLPDPPIGGSLRFVNLTDGWLTGGPAGDQAFLTHDAGRSWTASDDLPELPRPPAPRNLAPDAAISQFHFVSPSEGWLASAAGQCEGFKTNCFQQTRLYRTSDGGRTATDVTPDLPPHRKPRHGPVLDSTAEGFDKCSADSLTHMQSWWHNSPYKDVNIYIGGSSRACSQSNLTSSWVAQMLSMGWRLIPTWVGPQAPCTTFSHKIPSDPAAADLQGASEADAAVDAAVGLGLFPTVIYYDLEYYNNTDAACDAAVRSFVNGWVRQSHTRGIVAGAYSSPYDLQGWALLDHPPDAVWVAKWDKRDTVWGLTPLSDSLWANRSRLHQYAGGHNETWGGVTFNIDSDVEDGPVAVVFPRNPPAADK